MAGMRRWIGLQRSLTASDRFTQLRPPILTHPVASAAAISLLKASTVAACDLPARILTPACWWRRWKARSRPSRKYRADAQQTEISAGKRRQRSAPPWPAKEPPNDAPPLLPRRDARNHHWQDQPGASLQRRVRYLREV